MASNVANGLNALKAAKVEDEAENWVAQMKKYQGSGVSYLSAPIGGTTYSAAALGGR